MEFDPAQHPHRRKNPLNGEHVLVSPHRSNRPWQGQLEPPAQEARPHHDPSCYLCPGNTRANGAKNPDYEDTFVFANDFSALTQKAANATGAASMFESVPVQGECRVVCFSPRHDLSLAEMSVDQIERVVDTWSAQVAELSKSYTWVQVFENKGEAMGCSNPHPHGQIWASDSIPSIAETEGERQRQHFEKTGRPLLLDALHAELASGERVVEHNEHWLLVVPFWATWPFEYLLLPRRHVLQLTELTPEERTSLAEILQSGLVRYDNLFQTSFPYSMGWHGAPADGQPNDWWQLHAHFYPPLLRSASVRKFMVGYEMLAEPQRDITPEQAAKQLRQCSSQHYRVSETA